MRAKVLIIEMKKGFLILVSELLAYICAGFFMGWLLDSFFDSRGWMFLASVLLAYALWCIKVYKKLSSQKQA